MKLLAVLMTSLFLFFNQALLSAETEQDKKAEEVAGKIFGAPVSMGNYYFAKRALMVFGVKWGSEPANEEELEAKVWDNLLLSFEAFRRGIEVSVPEVEEEISKTLKSEKLDFNWKENKVAFDEWLKVKMNENSELFTNQLRYLIQIKKLREQVVAGFSPIVTEEETHQEFLNEYNTLELELAQFDSLKDAQDFFKKIKNNTKLWEKEMKKNPKISRRPGFVALEFLMDMWKVPKDALYEILKINEGAIYPEIVTIYSNKSAAIRLIKKKVAQEEEFVKLKQSYFDQVTLKKKYESLDNWFKNLRKEADIEVFVKK